MASLRIVRPGQEPKVYNLYKRLTSIGRLEANDVCLPDPLLPETLAHIHFDGREFHLTTADKKDAVLINGKRRHGHRLTHEDRLRIGDAEVTFLLTSSPAEEPAGAATGAAPAGAAGAEVESFRRLYSFSARLMDNYDLGELLAGLMDAILSVTRGDKGFLILFEGERMDIKIARNVKKENIANALAEVSDSIIAKAVREKRPIAVADALHDHEFSQAVSVLNLRLSSVLCLPLLERGNLLGLIYVGFDRILDHDERFAPERLAVLEIFAAQASLILRNALLVSELRLDNRTLAERLERIQFGSIVGACPAMQDVFKKITKVAATDVSVLVSGDTGTGKELIARELHVRSPRAKGPFVTINCGAIPESLLESELFGHVRGAFTGAVANRPGKFQAANGGTLFLDEIGEMPAALQVKLLRALQERVVVRVGDNRSEPVDIRVVAATNKDLDRQIKAGAFREDLYYRLNVIHVHLPPLRERGDDIVVLAKYLLQRHAEGLGVKVKGFTMAAVQALKRHPWPGNIRELDNRIQKALVLADKALLGPEDLDLKADAPAVPLPLAEAREQWQRKYIREVLELNSGNRTQTARDLAVDPRTIFRYLEGEREGEESEPPEGAKGAGSS